MEERRIDNRFRWHEYYSVGVRQFDSDHRRLLELANTMVNETLRGPLPELPGDVLNDLIECTEQHFAHEERLLTTTGYAGLEHHKDEHRRLLGEIRSQQSAFNAGRITADDVARFLADWLFNHMEAEDRHYGEHLNSLGYR